MAGTSSISFLSFLLGLLFFSESLYATQWNVGPTRTYTTPAAVSGLVDHGDTILIDAALYANHPQVYFSKNNLFIQGIGGRPRLEAGASLANNANGKAIFVISGSDCRVDNIEFANAVVPDNNGAGIRQEGCDLTVTHCYFNGNEMGILGGNLGVCTVRLEHNVFLNNGSTANPGYQHNVYIGRIDSLIFRYNYSVNAIAEGHELKSRAANNIILYNYIGNLNTEDSRTVDLPNGGTVILVGNILEQGPISANSNIFGYGLEGMVNAPPHHVWIVNNTFLNNKSSGNFIQVANGTDTLYLRNNILVGPKTSGLIQGTPMHLDSSHNLVSNEISAAGFIGADTYDYHLQESSPAINQGELVNKYVGHYSLRADHEYIDTAQYIQRYQDGVPDIGAFEFEGVTSIDPLSLSLSLYTYPNPCHHVIMTRDIPENTPYQLYTLTGQYVQGGIVIHNNIDVSRLRAGAYVIRIQGKSARIVKG